MTQNDKPGTVYLMGPGSRSFGHVDVLDNGWVYCRNGQHGENPEVAYFPAHKVEKIERDTDQ